MRRSLYRAQPFHMVRGSKVEVERHRAAPLRTLHDNTFPTITSTYYLRSAPIRVIFKDRPYFLGVPDDALQFFPPVFRDVAQSTAAVNGDPTSTHMRAVKQCRNKCYASHRMACFDNENIGGCRPKIRWVESDGRCRNSSI